MELIIIQHWRLPSAVLIPVLQSRLAHCFQEGVSQALVIPTEDWSVLYGYDLPDRILDCISQRYGKDCLPIQQIRLGSNEVFMTLQREWYAQKNILFVSHTIPDQELDLAIQFWLHELELRRK